MKTNQGRKPGEITIKMLGIGLIIFFSFIAIDQSSKIKHLEYRINQLSKNHYTETEKILTLLDKQQDFNSLVNTNMRNIMAEIEEK